MADRVPLSLEVYRIVWLCWMCLLFLVIISAYNLLATPKLGVNYFRLCSHAGGGVLFLNVVVVHRGGVRS